MTNHHNRSRRIWVEGDTVCLRAEEWGEETIRRFWVPSPKGYVREVDDRHPGLFGQQVCERLSNRGGTLYSSRDGLLDLIRREYRAAVAAEKRERAR